LTIDLHHRWILNAREYQMGNQSKMDNQEKLATQRAQCSRRRQTKQRHNAICVGHRYMQTNINNVNEIRALLQTARGKNEQNIFFIRKSKRTYQHGPQNTKTHNRTVHKVKRCARIPLENRCKVRFLRRCRQILLLIEHPPCYSYIESSTHI
jgi:hypothetical protein